MYLFFILLQNLYGTNLIATAGSDVLYYQYNNHGDVISVLDQDGTVKNEYDYDAFGNAAGNVANQAISKGVKNISAKEAAVAGATGILDVAGDAAGVALKKVGSKAVSKIVGAVGERAGAVAAKKAGAKAAQKTLASSAAAGVVGAGADAIPEGKIASVVGGENVYDLMKRKGIPTTLSDEEIVAAKAVDLRMQAGKKSISGTVGKSGSSSIDTPINSGVSRPRDVATPNSIYEQMNPDRTVKSRAFYDENGNQFSRQDFDHRHYDKKQNNIINHMNITIHIMKRGNRLEKVIGHSLKGIQISQQIKERKYI